jgi:hypothetical protein
MLEINEVRKYKVGQFTVVDEGDMSAEASSLGIGAGYVLRTFIVEDTELGGRWTYSLKRTERDNEGEVLAWIYENESGELVTIFND